MEKLKTYLETMIDEVMELSELLKQQDYDKTQDLLLRAQQTADEFQLCIAESKKARQDKPVMLS